MGAMWMAWVVILFSLHAFSSFQIMGSSVSHRANFILPPSMHPGLGLVCAKKVQINWKCLIKEESLSWGKACPWEPQICSLSRDRWHPSQSRDRAGHWRACKPVHRVACGAPGLCISSSHRQALCRNHRWTRPCHRGLLPSSPPPQGISSLLVWSSVGGKGPALWVCVFHFQFMADQNSENKIKMDY